MTNTVRAFLYIMSVGKRSGMPLGLLTKVGPDLDLELLVVSALLSLESILMEMKKRPIRAATVNNRTLLFNGDENKDEDPP